MYKTVIKRGIDIILSIAGLILLFPVFLIISVLIKGTSNGPIIFVQERVGRNQQQFRFYKFRSMKVHAPSEMPTHLLKNPDEYITRVGKFLRKTSLDELPQIINILKGDMSIIGPRPSLLNQEDLNLLRAKAGVNRVRPGLTGLAQIQGRDELDIKTKVYFDKKYVDNLSFRMDLMCFFKTIFSVLKQDGIVEGAQNRREKEREK